MARKKIALITGVTGQDGAYLAELLLDNRACVEHAVEPRETTLTRDIGVRINPEPKKRRAPSITKRRWARSDRMCGECRVHI